ncbi:polysaccharide biosynthesis protein [Sphingobacterium mizutaii NBRC 14946 = DSM 11724]|uniref:Polysaccharide export protein Wza n=2 Tax=Sphingobacterium mizutaii TaxID=1010 RepID=A0AAJ4XGY9_9SPHI|nr:polysaccharide biosynthesis/export family protein [Sphingobacterium mizutaii]GEM66506.1 polysaccharide biosynthesis protein [Sphingobacterium mizutaii NBRC 14946 = DSM 11724]SDL52722.1 polysaccharide export outer membrane protein [Sphingobacterium mizutaii]SNV62650.1 polysaccharide export protein Wza [Sphingobacterium mizutaii]
MRILLAFIIAVSLFTSCASRKDLVYFQPDSLELNTTYELNAPKLQPGDILAISITADDVRATAPFNQVSSYNSTGTLQTTNPFIPTYSIDVNGEIDFPKIGKIKIGGKTRTEAMEFLKSEVSRFIINPGVSMEIRNFRITVLGEVKSPGSYSINNDRITILEAIGMAGDLTINGIRHNVLVIREQNGKKEEFRIDLTKNNSLNSPVYYLAQNDVIYVEPNGAKIQSSKYTQNTSIFVSIASLIITIIAVIVR